MQLLDQIKQIKNFQLAFSIPKHLNEHTTLSKGSSIPVQKLVKISILISS